MKKIFCVLLAFLMAFALTSCVAETDNISSSVNTSETISVVPEFIEEHTAEPNEITGQPNAPPTAEPAGKTENADTNVSSSEQTAADIPNTSGLPQPGIDENGSYTSRDDVALYIHIYGHLPYNFITKKDAQALGWSGGSLEPYAPGKCIGGSYFGNYEGLLPEKDGRSYTECDIDTLGKDSRGAKRIVFSNDGLIYYTDDHYESFTLLYGEE